MKAIGIDLGTTNSASAYCELNRRDAKVQTTSAGENLTPSVVSFRRSRRDSNQWENLVGRVAVNYSTSAPEDTIFSIKRLMGRDYNDPIITKVRDTFNYRVVKGPGDDPRAFVHAGERDYSPIEISAMILKQIKDDASRVLGDEVTHAVITVPAYFNEGQRAATREAGERAGLVVKKIIDEPTAAAIAFGVQMRAGERHRILVYDLGGGTFDISILQTVKDQQGRDQFQGLQIEGDTWLGGDDFDHQIVGKVVGWFKEKYHEDPSSDKRFLLLAKQKAEEAKRVLSHTTETEIVIPAAFRTSQGVMVDVEVPLTREEFEAMIQGYMDKSMSLVQKGLNDQGLTQDDISDVLLVGGATLTPLVYQTVENVFGQNKVRRNVNPMECVALGAGILAANLQGVECPECQELNDDVATVCSRCGHSLASARPVSEGLITGDITAMPLGIGAVKGTQKDVFVPIIPKGTPYPLREPMKERFQATSERKIVVPVYEGSDPAASRNAEQGVIEYELPQEIDVNTPVEVSFNYDRNRQLTVTVNVIGTNLIKTETLRRDRPRTTAPRSMLEEEIPEEHWLEDLAHTVDFTRHFLEVYQPYMEVSQQMKLQGVIERAQRLLAYPDEKEGRRMIRMLQMEVFSSGLATQLFLADQATEGVPPEEAAAIRRAATEVRQSHDRGERDRVVQQVRLLKIMVAKALERRTGIKEITDREDYGGLLRLLSE